MKFLITGATGGLGKGVLSHLAKHVPGEDFAASSSRADAARQFEDDGIQFRHADYDDLDSLKKAFQDVEKLLFVSSSTFDNEKRTIQHGNVIAAAKTAGVRHVCQGYAIVMYRATPLLIQQYLPRSTTPPSPSVDTKPLPVSASKPRTSQPKPY